MCMIVSHLHNGRNDAQYLHGQKNNTNLQELLFDNPPCKPIVNLKVETDITLMHLGQIIFKGCDGILTFQMGNEQQWLQTFFQSALSMPSTDFVITIG